MTVEEKFRAQISGDLADLVDVKVIENACESPIEVKLSAIDYKSDYVDLANDGEWFKSYEYALSTFYYSLSGMIVGGTRSEQVGDVRSSITVRPLSDADRAYFRSMGDALRKKLGFAVAETVRERSRMFDGKSLGTRTPNVRIYSYYNGYKL